MSDNPMIYIVPPDQRPAWDGLRGMPPSRGSDRQPMIIGHRGARGLAPENTLTAFQVAIDLKIDGVEFDVQRTTDGHLVVFHDEDTSRVCGVEGAIADMTLDEVRALDAGAHFDARFRGVGVPTLRELLDLLRPTEQLLFVELKDPWRFPGLEEQTAALLREYDLVERSQVRSFFHRALHVMARVAPEIAISELWWDRLPTDDEVTFKTVNAFYPLYTPGMIAHLHARGQEAEAWTVNDLDAARVLVAEGIDALTTDYPDRLLTLFAS
jgi:glycerophosphoryl diester phosphodiesterase